MSFRAWPDQSGEKPVDCCPMEHPCGFHKLFPGVIRSLYRSQENAVVDPDRKPPEPDSPLVTP